MARIFLTAEWRHLAMVNYEIDPRALQPLVPSGTELDTWSQKTYVSMVGFLFLKTRVLGVAIPFHRHFEEINLRFYVRRKSDDGWRRGVVFVREVVPRRAIAAIARWVYNENYRACPTSSSIRLPSDGEGGLAAYQWSDNGQKMSIQVEYEGTPEYPKADSEEEFITEHYWGYASQRDGSTVEYRVEHPQWRVWPASKAILSGDFRRFYGQEFGDALSADPRSAFVADGSSVSVYRGVRMPECAAGSFAAGRRKEEG